MSAQCMQNICTQHYCQALCITAEKHISLLWEFGPVGQLKFSKCANSAAIPGPL